MLKIMEGERPVRPWEAQELGLVDSVWNMADNCWQQNPDIRPTMATVVGFLRDWSVVSLRTINIIISFPQLHATCCEPVFVRVGYMATNGGRK